PAYAGLWQCRHGRSHDVLATEEHFDTRHDELASERSSHGRITDRERRIPAMGLAPLSEHTDQLPTDEGPREARAGTETEAVEHAEEVGFFPDARAEKRAQRRFVGARQASQHHRAVRIERGVHAVRCRIGPSGRPSPAAERRRDVPTPGPKNTVHPDRAA